MSTPSTFFTRVRRELEEDTAQVWSNTSLVDWANDAVYDMATRLRNNIDEQYTDSVVGQETYALPTHTVEVIRVSYDDVMLMRLKDSNFFDTSVYYDANGTPLYYAIMDGYLYLTPTPSAIKQIRFFRRYRPAAFTSVSATSNMPWEGDYDKIISYYIKARAWEQVPDFEQMKMNEELYQRELDNAVWDNMRGETGDYWHEPETLW